MHHMIPKLNTTRSNVQGPLEHYKVKGTPYVFLLVVSPCPKFQSVSFYDRPLWKYRPFWDMCTKWPQNDIEPYNVKGTPYILLILSPSPKFQTFHSTTSRFWVTDHFETSAGLVPKWPKATLKTARSKVICVNNKLPNTNVPKSSFIQFCSTTSCSWDVRLPKIVNALNDLRLTLNNSVYIYQTQQKKKYIVLRKKVIHVPTHDKAVFNTDMKKN